MTIDKIKPIPKYMIERIRKAEKSHYLCNSSFVRFYSYLTKNDGELGTCNRRV